MRVANPFSDFLQGTIRSGGMMPGNGVDRLADMTEFGANPGALNARVYLPPNLSRFAPLVVVLHGCTQTAAGYDHGSGWSQLADIGGFALLFPEQRRDNNPNLCFNWFLPVDIRRGDGEAASIRQMVETMVERYPIDRERMFVTGLSAGGAMAAAMLATYPEVFAGGAVIAGLPYGCAANVPQALKQMRGEGRPNGTQLLADSLRSAAGHDGSWPKLTVWHGTADATVAPSNAEATLAQWRAVRGLSESPDRTQSDAGLSTRIWHDANGEEVLKSHTVTGMGHGTPLKVSGDDSCGVAGPYMLDVGISSSCHDARAWGLLDPATVVQASSMQEGAGSAVPEHKASTPWRLAPADMPTGVAGANASGPGPGAVIENALRKAGLMR